MLEARCLLTTGLIVDSFFSDQVLRYDDTTGTFLGTFATGLPDDHPLSMTIGPDRNLYVGVNNFGGQQESFIRRFDGETGTFLDTFASGGGLSGPGAVVFGPDGNLYVASFGGIATNSKVIRYNGITGAYIDDFVPVGSGGLEGATSLVFGPDHNLYVTSRVTDQVLRYNGMTGAFIDVFATGGNNGPQDLVFGPDGNLYVVDDGNRQVLRFNGMTGQFIDVFATGEFGTDGIHLVFGPDRNLYVTSGFVGNSVLRFDGLTGQFLGAFVPSGSGGLSYATGLLFFPSQAGVSCSVAEPLVWPPNHQLVNVGLSVDVQPPDATVQVQVYANDNGNSSDAADIDPDTLQLRAERQGNGSGRVYLIVVTAMSGGQSVFDVCTVVVPHDQSAGSIAEVKAEAAAAEAYYREFQTAPPGYDFLGQGPTDGGDPGSPGVAASIGKWLVVAPIASVNPLTAPGQLTTAAANGATDARGNVLAGGTLVSEDGYFALCREENGEADTWMADIWLNPDGLIA
jgi:DNA-binding beta-propeller fold protein YncE